MSEVWGAGTYERLAARLAPVQDQLVDLLKIGPQDRVLDLATGTGEVAVRVARRGAAVTGIDLAEPTDEEEAPPRHEPEPAPSPAPEVKPARKTHSDLPPEPEGPDISDWDPDGD